MSFPKNKIVLFVVLALSTTASFAKSPLSKKELSKKIVIAVIDTGADTLHPSLRKNLWTNPGESGIDIQGRDRANNGLDDDGNGYVDDVQGWNFAGGNKDLSDVHGHGTHVAGIIQSNAPEAQLMVLKYFDPQAPGEHNMINTVKAIRYAIKMKVQIINYSGGGTSKYPDEELAIREAQAQGILFVAAAGNERSNSDLHGFYPADYKLSNIISVTAIDENRKVLPSSNYGSRSVDIAAPGKDIVSSLPGGKFGTMTGTSQATAFVAGSAALLMAENPHNVRNPEAVIRQLTGTGLASEFLIGKTKHESSLDIDRARIMKDADAGAFGTLVTNTYSAQDFSSKLEPDSDDAGAEELPFK